MLDEEISVAAMARYHDPDDIFALPLSVEAFDEYSQSTAILNGLEETDDMDTRKFAWGNSSYTPTKYYKFIFSLVPRDRALDLVWKSKSLPKLRVFMWLLIHDRLNTKDLMLRKHGNFDGGPHCVLCNNSSLENRYHLFFDCPFAVACWNSVHITWNTQVSVSQRILDACHSFTGPCFVEVVAYATWNIWKARNDMIFRDQDASHGSWRVRFSSDLMLHQYRVKANLVAPLLDWSRIIFS